MNIGDPVKVTEEPRPERGPRIIPMPQPKEPVPVRRKPSQPEEPKKYFPPEEYYGSESVPVQYCPYCKAQLALRNTDLGLLESCPKHGYFGFDERGNLVSIEDSLA
jgi:hypothetical protein